ncbi:type VI secretion system-associated protein [Halomonas sp. G11]|nr:type VI secretion system-associated protein [Halomonas sp. G11]
MEKARSCAEESSRLERLNCYDALFKTPTPSGDTSELPALWHAIERQEAARAGDDMGLTIRKAGSDVLISVPALGTTPPRPVMVMACENLITRFQLHMPVAIDSARVTLELSGHGGVIEQQWRVRDGGQVISGGRGLPAIDTLRQLLGAEELTLRSDESALDGLRFDVSGLREDIQPLRDACRW